MAKLTATQARELARKFLDASTAVGNYRFDNWAKLTKEQRSQLEADAWDLLNFSTSFTTSAVGIALDDVEASAQALVEATEAAKRAIERINNVKQAIGIAAALIQLGGAIVSKDPGAIAKALGGVKDAVTA